MSDSKNMIFGKNPFECILKFVTKFKLDILNFLTFLILIRIFKVHFDFKNSLILNTY